MPTVAEPLHLSWASAYAVGLAYSAKSDDACVSELLGATRARTDILRGAAGQLGELVELDPNVQVRASRLLASALRTATAHPAGKRLLAS